MDPQRHVLYSLEQEKLKAFHMFEAQYLTMLKSKVWSNAAEFGKFKALVAKAESGDKKAESQIRQRMKAVMSLGTDAFTDNLDENEFYKMIRHKFGSSLAAPGTTSPIIETFQVWQNEFAIDLRWMLLFATKDMRANLTGKVVDFRSAVKMEKLTEQQDVPYGFIGDSIGKEVTKERMGGGLAFERHWLERNGFVTANDALSAIRMKHEEFKSTEHWDKIYKNAGVVRAFNTDLQTTINEAYSIDIIDSLKGNGYGLTATTPVYLIHNHTLTQTVNKAIFALRGENGTSPVVEYNVVPISTDKVPKQITEVGGSTAHDSVLMVLPGRNLMYCPFDTPSENEAFKWEKNTIQMGIQDFYTPRVGDNKQIVKVRISA